MKRILIYSLIVLLLNVSLYIPAVNAEKKVGLRKFPYPYQSMLSISTDIDGSWIENFRETHRFIHTKEQTTMGEGLGLDIADSFWFYIDNDRNGFIDVNKKYTWQDQMSYFNGTDWTDERYAKEIRKYINAGWIDSIHSFGDFSKYNSNQSTFKRIYAEKAIEELKKHNLKIKVWINHGNVFNTQNFGGTNYGFATYQQGDTPGKKGYHTDLTIPYGIKYLWDSNGDQKLGSDSLIYPITLNDQQKIWGYKRYTHTIQNQKTKWLWNIHALNDQLSEANLNKIVNNQWYSIISQHIGNVMGYDRELPPSAVQALKRLKNYQDNGLILVSRTSRLLDYHRVHDFLNYEMVAGSDTTINIKSVKDPVLGEFIPKVEDLKGITFYVSDAHNTQILINNKKVPETELQVNTSNGISESIGFKWFEPDYFDYTRPLVEVIVNNHKVDSDNPAFIDDYGVYIPAKATLDLLGYSVEWNANEKGIQITDGKNIIYTEVGSKEFKINDRLDKLKLETKIVNGTTYIDSSLLSKHLGYKMEYSFNNEKLSINFLQ